MDLGEMASKPFSALTVYRWPIWISPLWDIPIQAMEKEQHMGELWILLYLLQFHGALAHPGLPPKQDEYSTHSADRAFILPCIWGEEANSAAPVGMTMTGYGMTCLFPIACWYCLPSHQSPCCLQWVRAPGFLPITFRSTGYMGLPCTMETLVGDSHWVSKQQDFTFPYKPRPLFV